MSLAGEEWVPSVQLGDLGLQELQVGEPLYPRIDHGRIENCGVRVLIDRLLLRQRRLLRASHAHLRYHWLLHALYRRGS